MPFSIIGQRPPQEDYDLGSKADVDLTAGVRVDHTSRSSTVGPFLKGDLIGASVSIVNIFFQSVLAFHTFNDIFLMNQSF